MAYNIYANKHFKAGWLFLKDWIPGQASLPGMTQFYGLGWFVLGTFSPFHLSTFPPQKHLS
ncbi:MAG: hypothetical protein BWX75_01059 [Candidatus Cloacimonetes bacterium ADurb.Bin088]|jgi:hypothetical protein|nr:MAG: hypothetical protein BWX75_01059 [Candidatus Cloacimonetes bacterium ADurb.Bin088]